MVQLGFFAPDILEASLNGQPPRRLTPEVPPENGSTFRVSRKEGGSDAEWRELDDFYRNRLRSAERAAILRRLTA